LHWLAYNHRPNYYFYAFGELFQGRAPLYFVRALLVKAALATVLLALICGARALWSLRTPSAHAPIHSVRWQLIVPPVAYYTAIACNAPALGARYVLPVLPFLWIAAGHAGAVLSRIRSTRIALATFGLLQMVGFATSLQTSPLAYFNGLFCSTGDMPACLDDSNLDWGQALPALQRFRDSKYPGEPLRLFYVGSSPPAAYMSSVTSAAPQELLHPQAGLYALSLHLFVRVPNESWTRSLAPVAIIGGVYALYDLRRLEQPLSPPGHDAARIADPRSAP
jgi:hypothetical protein